MKINETIIFTFFTFLAYLLIVGFQQAYLAYFNIPVNFLNINLFYSIGYFILILYVLALTYGLNSIIYSFYDNYLISKIKLSQKYLPLKIILTIFYMGIAPLLIPFIINYLSFNSIKNTLLYLLVIFPLVTLLWFIEFKFSESQELINEKIIKLFSRNSVWLISVFIIFYSLGHFYASNIQTFQSYDNGKSVIIHYSKEHIFVKELEGGKLNNEGDIIIHNIDKIEGEKLVLKKVER